MEVNQIFEKQTNKHEFESELKSKINQILEKKNESEADKKRRKKKKDLFPFPASC